jgi:hypothetical protein
MFLLYDEPGFWLAFWAAVAFFGLCFWLSSSKPPKGM